MKPFLVDFKVWGKIFPTHSVLEARIRVPTVQNISSIKTPRSLWESVKDKEAREAERWIAQCHEYMDKAFMDHTRELINLVKDGHTN